MPQQIIMTAGGELRVIETGPPGPPGAPGSGTGNSNSAINLADIRYADSILDGSQVYEGEFDEEDFANTLASPLPFPTGLVMAVVNATPDIDGIYYGMSPMLDIGDPESWQPAVRIENITTKAILAGVLVTSFVSEATEGLCFARKDFTTVPHTWTVDQVSGEVGEPSTGVVASGAFLLDLRSVDAELTSPLWEDDEPPGDYVLIEPLQDLLDPGDPTFSFLPADFSVLPDNRDTLVVLMRNGRFNVVPTAWPSHERGPWSICFQFEDQLSTDQLMMGVTQKELESWGFLPTTLANVLVEYHSARGDS
jgi:hypothetical protein